MSQKEEEEKEAKNKKEIPEEAIEQGNSCYWMDFNWHGMEKECTVASMIEKGYIHPIKDRGICKVCIMGEIVNTIGYLPTELEDLDL